MEDARTSVRRLFAALDARFKSEAGVPTGIAAIDKAGGLRAGELVVLAGHPGVGKTSLAISIACHAARAPDSAVLWFSLAETTVQTIERFHLHVTNISLLGLRTGNLQRQDMTDLTYAAVTLGKFQLHIEDAIDLTAPAIREATRAWRAATTASRLLVIVDYLQLVAEECDPTAVLRSLLGTAKQSGASLLLVSQHLADSHQRTTLESIATAVVYLRADLQTHEIVLAKHRYCQTPQTEEVTFAGSTFASVDQSS